SVGRLTPINFATSSPVPIRVFRDYRFLLLRKQIRRRRTSSSHCLAQVGAQLADPFVQRDAAWITQRSARVRQAMAIVDIVVNGATLVFLAVFPHLSLISLLQALPVFKFPNLCKQRVFHWVAQLAQGKSELSAELEIKLIGTDAILV